MTKKRGLGRGLDALLGTTADGHTDVEQLPDEARSTLKSVPLSALRPGAHQPRKAFDAEALSELADSIRAQGIIQPLLVRPLGRGRFEIVAGERRWRAAEKAGLDEVPVIVREIDEPGAMAVALVENIQRADLNALEEAEALRKLINECGITHAQAADAVGRSRAAISNLLRLFDLPDDVQALLRDGKLSFGHGRALLAADAQRRSELAARVVMKGLSVRETERLAASDSPPTAKAAARPERNPYTGMADEVADRIGLPVAIRAAANGRGRMTISFSGQEELKSLLNRLAKD